MTVEQMNQQQLKTFLLIIAVIIILLFIASAIKNYVKRLRHKFSSQISSAMSTLNTMKEFSQAIKEAKDEGPQIKSIGGSTRMFLDRIQKDFPDFHNPDAENAIKTFITEYINVKFGKQRDFIKSKTDGNVLIDVSNSSNAVINNIIINAIAIYNYTKSRDYATITYKVSVGFDENAMRVETRYEIDYALQLYKDNIAMLSMVCPNCGATYDSAKDSVCPYCGTSVIKDTVMTWVVSAVREIK